jgi:cysteine desulfurase family protein (TIGR01976 family)
MITPAPLPLDVERCREQFPALAREVAGRPAVYFDGPAGSQVPRRVADAIRRYLLETNANTGGAFPTSLETREHLDRAHATIARLLGADDPDCVVFGPNMTTLTMHLAAAFARVWGPGDEIVLTRLEHDANFTPWARAARDAGAVVRVADVRTADCTLDLDSLRSCLNARTRLVALGCASNAVGTIHPFREVAALVRDAGALLFLDAVHYAPHAAIDVTAWDCDFLACSAYKFFGPHVGILWGRRALLERLPATRLRTVADRPPERWMPGTQNHEGLVGAAEAVEYLTDLGRSAVAAAMDPRTALLSAFGAIAEHERALAQRLLGGLAAIPAVRVYGITEPRRAPERVPTVAFAHARHRPAEVAQRLAARGIFVWHGNFYALPLTEALGVEPDGLVRVGLLHYNTADEVDRLLNELDSAG